MRGRRILGGLRAWPAQSLARASHGLSTNHTNHTNGLDSETPRQRRLSLFNAVPI